MDIYIYIYILTGWEIVLLIFIWLLIVNKSKTLSHRDRKISCQEKDSS